MTRRGSGGIPATLNDALEMYEEARGGGYSASTWEAHTRQLEKFRAWVSRNDNLGGDCLLSEIDERLMNRYFNRLRPPALAPSSFNNYRQYLKLFFDFARAEAWVERNPMRHVDPVPVPKRKRLQLSAQELLQGLETASPRDRIALAIGMNTALRSGDIMSLKVGDVNLTNDTLHAYIRKTKTYDDIPITTELRAELIRWFAHYAQVMGVEPWEENLPNRWTLVPPAHWQAVNVWKAADGGHLVYKPDMTNTKPQEIVHRMLERLGHPTYQEGFHTLRRSTARRFYELAMAEGVKDPMRMPQALLGHKRRDTTEHYLGMTVEKQMRDDLLRGKSFLRVVAETERNGAANSGVDDREPQAGRRLRSAGG